MATRYIRDLIEMKYAHYKEHIKPNGTPNTTLGYVKSYVKYTAGFDNLNICAAVNYLDSLPLDMNVLDNAQAFWTILQKLAGSESEITEANHYVLLEVLKCEFPDKIRLVRERGELTEMPVRAFNRQILNLGRDEKRSGAYESDLDGSVLTSYWRALDGSGEVRQERRHYDHDIRQLNTEKFTEQTWAIINESAYPLMVIKFMAKYFLITQDIPVLHSDDVIVTLAEFLKTAQPQDIEHLATWVKHFRLAPEEMAVLVQLDNQALLDNAGWLNVAKKPDLNAIGTALNKPNGVHEIIALFDRLRSVRVPAKSMLTPAATTQSLDVVTQNVADMSLALVANGKVDDLTSKL